MKIGKQMLGRIGDSDQSFNKCDEAIGMLVRGFSDLAYKSTTRRAT